MYLPAYLKGRIDIFSADGNFLSSFGKLGFTSYPFSIAIDSHGTLLLSDYNHSLIRAFTLEGESLGSFGGLGNGLGKLNFPRGIAFGDCDVLCVCDSVNNRISIFESCLTLVFLSHHFCCIVILSSLLNFVHAI